MAVATMMKYREVARFSIKYKFPSKDLSPTSNIIHSNHYCEMTQIVTQQSSAESKRAKKRAEKVSRHVSESNNGQAYSSSPEFDREGSQFDLEDRKHPFLEVINKRIRALQKKKVRIDQYQALDVSVLNKDQLLLLEHKDQILAPLKELQELLKQIEVSDKEEQEFYARKFRRVHSEYDEKLRAVKKEGFKEGIGQVASLVQFLRHASWTRATPSNNVGEDAAVERVLTIVYEGGEAAVNHVNSLATGKDQLIEGIEGNVKITWARMKEMVEEKSAIYAQQTVLQEGPHESNEPLTFGNISNDISPDNSAQDIQLHQRPLQGAISFLNESEIDVQPQEESISESTIPSMNIPLAQTLVKDPFDAISHHVSTEFQPSPTGLLVDDSVANSAAIVQAQEDSSVATSTNGNKPSGRVESREVSKSDDDGFIIRHAKRQSRGGFEPRERGGYRGDFRGRGRGDGRGRGLRTRGGDGFKRGQISGDRSRGRGGFKKSEAATPIPAQ
ncbi:hypothetical protein NEOLI_002286 [Neolecta irregularis DAH-3]|uniref:YAG7-like dimerisation domain-containing protein n=1 Tax=Neolecta irregularis (strain DAH-3) TaxID=1198029 RepID=A0A1U7LTV5_NEOID|nr:hypothetical protein NEOLI_002286 [Neolecta irregularis DAH-3]|eukprot:OLL26059.1 hypothetical protein NEOLI_002286 [Neolecta irregularis DAH-3]